MLPSVMKTKADAAQLHFDRSDRCCLDDAVGQRRTFDRSNTSLKRTLFKAAKQN